ncbi:MAG: sulfotransferase family protein [Armatimonadota bacterium]
MALTLPAPPLRDRPEAPCFTGPPIFLSGCNRGGTTIMARLLSAHPEVRNVGRGQFCEGQYIWRRRFRDFSRHRWAIRPWLWHMRKTEEHATPELLEFFRREFLAALDGKGRMMEKTPANAVRIPFIDRLYPDCQFVHVIRDGRHTTASLIARRVLPPYAPHQWVGAHRTALADLARIAPERVTLVRYERLIQEPEQTLEEICRRTGLDWSESSRQQMLAAAAGSLENPASRWERFWPLQKRYILSVIGPLQAELGYPVEE